MTKEDPHKAVILYTSTEIISPFGRMKGNLSKELFPELGNVRKFRNTEGKTYLLNINIMIIIRLKQ
jgi:hypothetical protein